LDEALAIANRSRIERDGAVYTFETISQACQQLLADREKIVTGTANQTIRAAHRLGWLSEPDMEAIAEILRDRNLVAHRYCDEIGDEIEARLPAHATVLRRWLEDLRKQAGG